MDIRTTTSESLQLLRNNPTARTLTHREVKLYRLALKADERLDWFRWTAYSKCTAYQKSCHQRKVALDREWLPIARGLLL